MSKPSPSPQRQPDLVKPLRYVLRRSWQVQRALGGVLKRKIVFAFFFLLVVLTVGALGYYYLQDGQYSLLDCLYMTIITISTIGYEEIIPVKTDAGKYFTMGLALSGIAVFSYLFSNFTALLVEGEISQNYRRKRMEDKIANLHDHFIVCGAGRVGSHILRELSSENLPCVVIDLNQQVLQELSQELAGLKYLHGDSTEDELLEKAGIQRARGVFAATGEDSDNLSISLTAKHLNPRVRVVSRCLWPKHEDKIRKAGADYVISTNQIGALQMFSEMVRPQSTSFFGEMMRTHDSEIHFEELVVPQLQEHTALGDLGWNELSVSLCLGIQRGGERHYRPSPEFSLQAGDILLLMTTHQELQQLRKTFQQHQ